MKFLEGAEQPAYPLKFVSAEYGEGSYTGLSKREYLAAIALQGFISLGRGNTREMAEAAVMAADALIKELEKGKE